MTLHIRLASDLHLEHFFDLGLPREKMQDIVAQLIPPLPTDRKTVLVLAGDLASAHTLGRAVTFLELVQPRFKHVIYILGNHEHYCSIIGETENILYDKLTSSRVDLDKLTLAGNEVKTVVVKGVLFIVGTLWTNYFGDSAQTADAKLAASRYMNDHRLIYKNEDRLLVKPDDLHEIFNASRAKIIECLGHREDNAKTVVVTHHMPSFKAVDPKYTLDPVSRALNGAFCSDLEDVMLQYKPAYWFFGHTHTPYTGVVGDTHLVCNPLGYPNEYNLQQARFKTDRVISL